MYAKTYGTIVAREGDSLIVKPDTAQPGPRERMIRVNIRDRLGGRTPSESLQPGMRVKLFRGRPQDRDQRRWRFRRVGR